MITEILADPPPGLSGDANGDGVRSPSDDGVRRDRQRGQDAGVPVGLGPR